MDKDKLLSKYKNMKQYKDLPQEELEVLVQKKLDEEILLTSFVGLKEEEIPRAIKLYEQYVTECSFESLAEKSTLINLVRDEIIKERILTQMKEENENKNGANSLRLIEEIRELEEHILNQKEKLGMMRDASSESALDLINELKEKALNYYETHAGCTVVKCPHCQQLFNLLMDVTNLIPEKCSFFRGTMLYNLPLLNLYHLKKVTKLEVAEVLGVHENYVDFIYNNLYLRELNNNEEK